MVILMPPLVEHAPELGYMRRSFIMDMLRLMCLQILVLVSVNGRTSSGWCHERFIAIAACAILVLSLWLQ
jgi:hypothetical protein